MTSVNYTPYNAKSQGRFLLRKKVVAPIIFDLTYFICYNKNIKINGCYAVYKKFLTEFDVI